ncbi:ATP-binding protein [Embleya scabrispora]|uniref:ATP-binding protein n=1 Tax=Embleya scabrispora TaxID=159449 RepID=UPI00316ACBCA
MQPTPPFAPWSGRRTPNRRPRHAGPASTAPGRTRFPAGLDNLFEPFRRPAQDKVGRNSGHGLGLFIVRSIADAHGAKVGAIPGTEGGPRIAVTGR